MFNIFQKILVKGAVRCRGSNTNIQSLITGHKSQIRKKSVICLFNRKRNYKDKTHNESLYNSVIISRHQAQTTTKEGQN